MKLDLLRMESKYINKKVICLIIDVVEEPENQNMENSLSAELEK